MKLRDKFTGTEDKSAIFSVPVPVIRPILEVFSVPVPETVETYKKQPVSFFALLVVGLRTGTEIIFCLK